MLPVLPAATLAAAVIAGWGTGASTTLMVALPAGDEPAALVSTQETVAVPALPAEKTTTFVPWPALMVPPVTVQA